LTNKFGLYDIAFNYISP